MFSLIWYFGLISFVVSAHSNNDTLHGGYKLNISTTMSTLPSPTIPVANDCVLEMKEIEISEIVELFNNDRVHVVDIQVSFSGTSHNEELLSDFRVKLLNPVGRETLYFLFYFGFLFPYTLNAGIRNFKLHINESLNDCIKRQKNVTDFAFENMQNIVRRVNLATNYKVWYSFTETSSGKARLICCQITKHNLPKCSHAYSTGNSVLFASNVGYLWFFISLFLCYFALFYLMWLLHVFLSRTEFDLEYPKYYKLEESLMSPSLIFFKIIFEKNGRVVSFIRSCALICVLSYFPYLLCRKFEIMNAFILVVLWRLSFGISYFCRPKITNSFILHKIKRHRKEIASSLPLIVPDGNEIRQGLASGEFAGKIKVLTLPFSRSYWRKTIKMLYNISAALIKRIKYKNRILKTLTLCSCCALAVLINALFVFIVFLYRIISGIYCTISWASQMLSLIDGMEHTFFDSSFPTFFAALYIFISCFSCILFCVTVVGIILAIESFLLGLFLNLIYFIPYFAFFSVLTFYCGNFWKTMEEKYLVLERLIYEACRDIQCVNNGCIPNRHPKREEKVLPVVSKELYDKIREKLLPYDTNLFYFALKIFWAFAFAFGILKLIEMLNEFNVTGVVQVITTASLGVMPHIFNMIALKTSEEKKKAREENLKLNVKYMVEDLLRADPELGRTVLIIQQNNDATTADENVQGSENVTATDNDATDNDDAEGSELTDVLIIQESNDTTADENVHDSEKTACLPELLARLCCNDDATTEHSSDNNDDLEDTEQMLMINVKGTTADVNVQDSENVQVSEPNMNVTNNDDAEGSKLTELLIIQENNDTTADENVHDSKKTEGSRKLLTRACCNNEATTEENVQVSEHPCVDDDVEDPELTRLLQEVYGTTTDENVPDYEDPELTRLLEEVYGTTTDKNVHDSEHPSDNDDLFDPELTRRLTSLREAHDTTPDDIVHKIEHIEARSGLNLPDNDNVEDPELEATLIIEGINDAPADEIDQHSEHVQGTYDLNRPDRDDMEEFPIAIVDAQKSRGTTADENVQDYERIEARSDLNSPDNDDMEEFPIVIVHAQENNDTAVDENVQDSERAQGSGLNRQNLRDNREENVKDYELVEVKCDNGGENGRVKENIQY